MMGHEAVVNLAACQRDAKVVEVVGAAVLADALDAPVGGGVRAGADAVFQAVDGLVEDDALEVVARRPRHVVDESASGVHGADLRRHRVDLANCLRRRHDAARCCCRHTHASPCA